MKAKFWILALALVVAAMVPACGSEDDAGGPIDGVWLVTAFSCDGNPQQIGEFVLTVLNESGDFVQGFGPDCVLTIAETYTYPADGKFAINPQSIECNPNSGCEAILGAACPPTPPATEFSYQLSGNTLTFTRTASGPGDLPCQDGQEVRFLMERQ